MNEKRKSVEKKTLRRVILILCLGAAGDVAAIVLLRRGGEHAPLIAAAVLIVSMGFMFTLLALTIRAGRRALQPFLSAPTGMAFEGFPPAENAPTELLVQRLGMFDEGYYRVVEGPQQYHFVRVRDQSWLNLGPSPEQLAEPIDTSGTDAQIRAGYQKGFAVNKADIQQLDLTFCNYEYNHQTMFSCGWMELQTTDRKNRRFALLIQDDAFISTDVERFFNAVYHRIRVDASHTREGEEKRRQKLQRAQETLEILSGQQNPAIARSLRKWVPRADFSMLILYLLWMFVDLFDLSIPPAAEAAIAALALMPWIGLLAAPNYISLIATEFTERSWLESHGVVLVSPLFGLFVPGTLLGLAAMAELDEGQLGKAFLVGAALSLTLVTLTYLRTPDAKRYRGVYLAVAVLMLMFSIAFGAEILKLLL